MGKSKASKVQVPECRYGAACTRKDCIFRHPPKKVTAASTPANSSASATSGLKTDKVCFAFIAGRCAFSRQCRDKHPDEATCTSIRERYSRLDCQWGRGCRTEGCLYKHPGDEPVGPAFVPEPQRAQPAVFADGPRIASAKLPGLDDMRKAALPAQVLVPKAIAQATDLRDASAFDISDPLERFIAVNARNTGSQSASLLDLHLQSVHTFGPILDEVLPERLQMFPQGVWVILGCAQVALPQRQQQRSGELHDAVQKYFREKKYDFAVGVDADGQTVLAFLVRGMKRRRREDDSGDEAALPPLPTLSQWIEAFHQIDVPGVEVAPPDRRVEFSAARPRGDEGDDGLHAVRGRDLACPDEENSARRESLVLDEDEERARQEQLAATLRCMGFDEAAEASLPCCDSAD